MVFLLLPLLLVAVLFLVMPRTIRAAMFNRTAPPNASELGLQPASVVEVPASEEAPRRPDAWRGQGAASANALAASEPQYMLMSLALLGAGLLAVLHLWTLSWFGPGIGAGLRRGLANPEDAWQLAQVACFPVLPLVVFLTFAVRAAANLNRNLPLNWQHPACGTLLAILIEGGIVLVMLSSQQYTSVR